MKKRRFFLLEALRVLVFMICPAAFFAPFGMPVFVILLACVTGMYLRQLGVAPVKPAWPELLLLTAFTGWGLLSCLWSVDVFRSLDVGLSLLGMFLAGIYLVSCLRGLPWEFIRLLAFPFACGVMLLGGMIVFDIHAGFSILGSVRDQLTCFEYHKPAVVFICALWLALTVFIGRRSLWLLPFFAIASVGIPSISGILDSDAVIVSLFAGLSGFLAILVFRERIIHVMMVLAVAGSIGGPYIFKTFVTPERMEYVFPAYFTSPSWYHRLVIWNYVIQKITIRPLTGYGLDSARNSLFKEKVTWPQPYYFPKTGKMWFLYEESDAIPLHPHNVIFQVWLELGLVGAVLLVGIYLVVFHRIASLSRKFGRVSYACFAATLPATLVIALVSYGAWQMWWISTIMYVYAMGVVVARYLTEEPKSHINGKTTCV